MFVRVGNLLGLVSYRVVSPKALGRSCNPVCVMEPCVEPLRRIRGRDLMCEHVLDFFGKGCRVLVGIEVLSILPPIDSTFCDASKHLAGVCFVSRRADVRGQSSSSHVLLSEDVDGYLRP